MTGATGTGKTFSALRLAKGLADSIGKRIAFIDTENDSASLYADFTEDDCRKRGIPAPFEFDVLTIAPPFEAIEFSRGIQDAIANDYGVVIIDSASHFWKGILAYKDQIDAHGKGNSYTNWKQADTKFDPVIEAVLQSKIHVIFCMRSKMDYVQEEINGKKTVKKVGMAPIMRDGLEFEFSAVLDIGADHSAQASKDRTGLFPSDRIFQVTEQTGSDVAEWLKTAKPKPEPEPPKELTDDEKKAKNVSMIRAMILKAFPGDQSTDGEHAFCDKTSALCEDNRKRARLEEFTLDELRLIYPKAKTMLKDLQTNGTAPVAA